jgi:hypothetical protein
MQIAFPIHLDRSGRTAETSEDAHIRDMIEQILFTSPGERVNRPDFGSGVLQAVFAPNSDQLTATIQYLVQGSLQQWLGDLIEVEGVEVEHEDSRLMVEVAYSVRRTQQQKVAQFTRQV